MVQRITYRRQNTYNTRSNRIRAVRTPGGRLVAHYIAKKVRPTGNAGFDGQRLGGLKRLGRTAIRAVGHNARSINRPYGGALTASSLRDRILTAFISEEVKEVKVQLALKEAEDRKKGSGAAKKDTKKKGGNQAAKKK